MSAGLLLGFDERPHLLRDDLESFVHILYYYVFRYRPTVPSGSAAQKRLFTSMDKVFNTVLYTGGEVIGGDDKANYLASATHFDPRMMHNYVHPEPLRRLMLISRDAFGPLYASEPLVDDSLQGDAAARQSRKLQSYRQALDSACARLQSSDYLISLFRSWTQEYDATRYQWPSNDAAVDQMRPQSPSGPTAKPGSVKSRSSRKRTIDVTDDVCSHTGKVRRSTNDRNISAGTLARRKDSVGRS